MTTTVRGRVDEVGAELQAEGVRYGVEIGRRAPLHRMHVDCLREIAEAGLKPIIIIGSPNSADSPLYDPVKNPFTIDQLKEQMRQALPDIYDEKAVIVLYDRGNNDAWLDSLQAEVAKITGGQKAAIHFRSKAADAEAAKEKIKALKDYEQGYIDHGFSVWESFNRNHKDDDISASNIRRFDLDHLTPEQRGLISTPDYVNELARKARDSNPDKELLEKNHIPLTTLDLTLDRMWREAGFTTASVFEKADENVTLDTLTTAAKNMIAETRTATAEFSAAATPAKTFPLKIASASCNQTGGDWPRNLENIFTAIDKAVKDGADVLSLEELGLSGYERGDDFFYSDNTETHTLLQTIADYAASQNPNLVVSVGHPWYFADKSIPDQDERRKNPIFNRINNNFNVQTLISGGEIISMSAKRYLFNYERGYEKRHFEEWSDTAADHYENKFGKGREGTVMIEMPAGDGVPAKVIPFGSPVVQVGKGDKKINLTHVICEEYWVGSRFDGSKTNADYARDNPLAQKANMYDITVALNPNASPPAANKIDQHKELSKLASQYCDVLVHTDGLGTSGSTFAQFGSRLMAQDGKIISEGVRASMKDVAYTSQVVNVPAAVNKGHKPHAVIEHSFADIYSAPVQDGPAPWEKGDHRAFEEEMRDECLWLFDYMRKNKIPGFMEAVSGGKDSAYNTSKIRVMVDLGCAELGVEGFMKALDYLPYKQKVLDVFHKDGQQAAVKTIMDNMLTAVYMGTENSSAQTLEAARSLIEGGARENGTKFDGIGGKFEYRNVQRLVELYAEIYAGVNPAKLDDKRDAAIRKEITEIMNTRAEDVSPEELARRVDEVKFTFEEVSGDMLSIAKPADKLAYQNLQARLRQVLIMLFSNVENKLAIANPNLDEARNSYATWGGDLHSGMISGNAHKNKMRLTEHLKLLNERGLDGIPPIPSLAATLASDNGASSELLKDKDGKKLLDEDDLGRSFPQMDAIAQFQIYKRMIERKYHPAEVFEQCRGKEPFAQDSLENLHDRIALSYEKWGGQTQAKIHGSPIAATFGENVDHQTSLRTPNISANQLPERTEMTLYCLSEIAKRNGATFETLTGGHSLDELQRRALVDAEFNRRINTGMSTPTPLGNRTKIATLYNHIQEKGFDEFLQPTAIADRLALAAQWRAKKRQAM